MAREWVEHCGVQVVAVTGSVGKTTTKEFISTLLRQKYRVAASVGNSNSQVGLPLSILNNLQESDEILVQEMGMTEVGQLTRLVSIAPPDVAVLTHVALVHACNFPSLREIAMAKAEIFTHERTKLGVCLRDIEHFDEVSRIGQCKKVAFSLNILDEEMKTLLDKLPVPGEHNRQNLLAAITVARYFGLNWEEITAGIGQLKLPERRLQFMEKKGIQFVNDSYNANVLSMKASFKSLPKPEKGKRLAVLGEMLELGKFSAGCHQEVGEASLESVDSVICYGKECAPIVACWERENRPVRWTCDWNELMGHVRELAQPGDVVLLKGSRGKELWKVVDEI